MERAIARLLQDADEPAVANAWLQACRQLDEGARVAVGARDAGTAGRAARRLEAEHPEIAWIPFAHATAVDDVVLVPDDRLLGAHALLWVTALPAPLGIEERAALSRMDALGAPSIRAVALVDAHVLERIADDPAAELAEVRERLRTLLPPGWPLLDDPAEWAVGLAPQGWGPDGADLPRNRRKEVARLLLGGALRTTTDALSREEAAVADIDALLANEDEALAKAERAGRRVAAHVLGATRRHLDALRLRVADLLARLEQDLPAQMDAMEDVDELRRVLPHWLEHVVSAALADELATWRANVLADLAEVGIGADEAAVAELLVPALHPPPLRGEAAWGHRLAVSAAIGGGALMLLGGLWIPGALVVSGGLVWSTLARDARGTRVREQLLDSARQALRRMGADLDQLLGDQIAQIEADVAELGADQARSLAAQQADTRTRLVERRAFHRARGDALRDVQGRLETQQAGLV